MRRRRRRFIDLASIWYIFFLIICVCVFDLVEMKRVRCINTLNEGETVQTLMKNYTKMLPSTLSPSDIDTMEDDAVIVRIEIHVQDVSSLNEITSDFEIDILFSQLWHDHALNFKGLHACKSNITMEPKYLDEVWTPNTCLINSKSTTIHASPTKNIMFILYENGTIWVNYRMQVKAPCILDLRSFPFDTQKCSLLFESYSYNSEEVKLQWFELPITLMKKIELPDFDLVGFAAGNNTLEYPNGLWDQLNATFIFKRRYGFYILQAYIPTYLTIMVSWVSFCMDPKALPARTTVGVSRNLPRVSYIKAMDVWMLGCISFVFATMVELAIVCYAAKFGAANSGLNEETSNLTTPQPNQSAPTVLSTARNGSIVTGTCGPLLNTTVCGPNDEGVVFHRRPQQRQYLGVWPPSASPRLIAHSMCNEDDDPCPSPILPQCLPADARMRGLSESNLIQRTERPRVLDFRRARPRNHKFWTRRKYPRGLNDKRGKFKIAPTCSPEKIDRASMVLFPLCFTIFNAVYWWYYLGGQSQIYNHEFPGGLYSPDPESDMPGHGVTM